MRNPPIFLTAFAMAVVFISGLASASHHQVIEHDLELPKTEIMGTYAGTILCKDGERGFSLNLDIKGFPTLDDVPWGPCRSGSGPCNDRQDARLSKSRKISGFVNLFPTLSNPGTSLEAYRVEGIAEYITKETTKFHLEPGADSWKKGGLEFLKAGLSGTIDDSVIDGDFFDNKCSVIKLYKMETY